MAKHQVVVLMGRAEATKSKLNQTRSFWCRKCEAYKITSLKNYDEPHNWMYAPVLRYYAVVTQPAECQPSKLDERVRFPSIAPRGRFIPMPEDSTILGTQTHRGAAAGICP